MNEIIKAMEERRSIRKFLGTMPPKEALEQIIEAGLYAASGKGNQSPIIVAVTDREVRDRLSEANRVIGGWKEGFDPFYGAPALLIVLAQAEWPTRVYDGSLVMGNMMLAAHSLGLGSIWIHRAKEEFALEEWKGLLRSLGVQGEWEGIGHCAIGYADGEAPQAAARKSGRVFWAE
ncbi:MAG: nitroreductase [Mailhella sp.]|nr:nitroreductase [Mailhella sp.]